MKRRTIITLALLAVLAALCGTFALAERAASADEYAQYAASRWGSGDMPAAMVSCFFGDGAPMSSAELPAVRGSLDAALRNDSISAPSDGARLWYDSYCAQGRLSLTARDISVDVSATATGGDFFTVHAPELVSGWYYPAGDIVFDRVVIDENTAWRLFGSPDVAGMEVFIGGRPFTVTGVVRAEGGMAVYLPYEAYLALGGTDALLCYEAVLPDPVRGYAKKIVSDAAGSAAEIKQNTGRYSAESLLKTLGSISKRAERTVAVKYPAWENSAAVAQDKAAILFAGKLLCAALFAATAAVWLTISRRDIKSAVKKFILSLKRRKKYEKA